MNQCTTLDFLTIEFAAYLSDRKEREIEKTIHNEIKRAR